MPQICWILSDRKQAPAPAAESGDLNRLPWTDELIKEAGVRIMVPFHVQVPEASYFFIFLNQLHLFSSLTGLARNPILAILGTLSCYISSQTSWGLRVRGMSKLLLSRVFGITVTSASSLLCDCLALWSTGTRWGWEDTEHSTSYNVVCQRSVCHWLDSETAGNNLQLLCSRMEADCPQVPCVWGWPQKPRAPPVLAAWVSSLPWEPYLPSFTLIQKRDFSWGSSSSVQKLGSSRAAVYLLESGMWIFTSQEDRVLLRAASWCFPKWVDGDGTFTACSWFPHCPSCTGLSKLQAQCLGEKLEAVCPACFSPPSGCVAQNAWLRSSWQVQAPGRAGFVAHLCSYSPVLVPSTPRDCVPAGFWAFHSGLCNIWLYPGFCRAIESGS